MNGSHCPIIQLFRRLCIKQSLYDPNLAMYDFEKVSLPETDERIYKLELEAMKRFREIVLPPNLALTLVKTRCSTLMACAGFFLSTL